MNFTTNIIIVKLDINKQITNAIVNHCVIINTSKSDASRSLSVFAFFKIEITSFDSICVVFTRQIRILINIYKQSSLKSEKPKGTVSTD